MAHILGLPHVLPDVGGTFASIVEAFRRFLIDAVVAIASVALVVLGGLIIWGTWVAPAVWEGLMPLITAAQGAV